MATLQANGSYPSTGADFAQQTANAWIESRRQQRAASNVTVWATSPLRAERSPSPEPAQKRRRRSLSDSSSSSDSGRDRKKRHSKHRSSKHSSSRREEKRGSRSKRNEEDEWVEAAPVEQALVRAPTRPPLDESDDEIGPMPQPQSFDKPADAREYGQRLLKGEGAAMAAYVAEGARIPRRGEIGIEADDVDKYEKAGFVMSGSRNKKMETVRTRKENQVISAEEKRSLLKMQKEEKVKREQDIIASFKEMVDKSLNPPPKPRPT